MKRQSFLILFLFIILKASSQESYRLMLEIPVFDYSENLDLPYKYPSMDEALSWSHDMYELGFYGIDELGNLLFKPGEQQYSRFKKFGNNAFKYALGLAFSKYGSELPIPLGVWGHEEFHRSVLGVNGISSKNGNWLFNRWDGTVYGVSDQALTELKATDPAKLLYSYVAGLQYEVLLNRRVTLDELYHRKTFPRSALLLYNAIYVYNYFRFASGSSSDSAKVLAPPHESSNPHERDFTGSDLNAWVYDMFNPSVSFSSRDPFPGGDGVNRRIGFSDLSSAEQNFLKDQKDLALLNFLNPAIFFIEGIRLSDDFSFNIFTQYMPTHFGNDIGVYLPVKLRYTGVLMNVHWFDSYNQSGMGFGLGLEDVWFSEKISGDIIADVWDQPVSFFGDERVAGGSGKVNIRYSVSDNFSAYVSISAKTKGWQAGDPYLKQNTSVQIGISYVLKNKELGGMGF